MNGGLSGGTPLPGEIDFDPIGRALVLALLSTGAGDGPDQSVVRDAGHYFGQAIGLVIDILVRAGVGPTQEAALRTVLNLPAQDYPTRGDLISAVAFVLAQKVRDGSVTLDEGRRHFPDVPDPGEPRLDDTDRQLLSQAGIPPLTTATSWTLSNAAQWLDACLDTEDPDYVETWLTREAWAVAYSVAGVAADVTPLIDLPSTEDGNEVHEVIQDRFREQYGPNPTRPTEILIERRIYRPSGDITLARLKFENARYRRLWLALRSPRFLRGSLRLDLADLTSMSIWEVKPIGGLAQAVAQLCFYTSAYNCLARASNAPERLGPSPVPLNPKVSRPVRLAPSAGRQRFAMLFQPRQVPGLVGYVVIVLPSLKELQTAAVIEVMRRLAKELRRLRGTQGPPSDDGVLAALMVTVIVIVLLVGVSQIPGSLAIAEVAATLEEAGSFAGALSGGIALPPPLSLPPHAVASTAHPVVSPLPVTLDTFAGPISCESPAQALAVLSALATTMFLGIGDSGNPRT